MRSRVHKWTWISRLAALAMNRRLHHDKRDFSISKRLRILGNFFSPHYPASHQEYLTNLTLIAHFTGFNAPNFIISVKNWVWNMVLLHCDRIHSQNICCCFWTICTRCYWVLLSWKLNVERNVVKKNCQGFASVSKSRNPTITPVINRWYILSSMSHRKTMRSIHDDFYRIHCLFKGIEVPSISCLSSSASQRPAKSQNLPPPESDRSSNSWRTAACTSQYIIQSFPKSMFS